METTKYILPEVCEGGGWGVKRGKIGTWGGRRGGSIACLAHLSTASHIPKAQTIANKCIWSIIKKKKKQFTAQLTRSSYSTVPLFWNQTNFRLANLST